MSHLDWRMLLRRNNSSPVHTLLGNKAGGNWWDWFGWRVLPAGLRVSPVRLSSPEKSVLHLGIPLKGGFFPEGGNSSLWRTIPSIDDVTDTWMQSLQIDKRYRASSPHIRKPVKWWRHCRELVEGATQRKSRNVSKLKDFGCRVVRQDTPDERRNQNFLFIMMFTSYEILQFKARHDTTWHVPARTNL